MTTTRHDDEIFLIGHRDLESLERLKQLPTVKQVLQRFHHRFSEQTVTHTNCHVPYTHVGGGAVHGGSPWY